MSRSSIKERFLYDVVEITVGVSDLRLSVYTMGFRAILMKAPSNPTIYTIQE